MYEIDYLLFIIPQFADMGDGIAVNVYYRALKTINRKAELRNIFLLYQEE